MFLKNGGLAASEASLSRSDASVFIFPRNVKTTGSFPYTERHLKCIWFDESLRPASLYTHEGERVIIEHPGRWNLEQGPDFLGASLQIEPAQPQKKETRTRKTALKSFPTARHIHGDVEIHVSASDWQKHGHSKNPAYSRVKTHVTYHPGYLPAGVLPRGSIQISLKNSLASNPLFDFDSIDLAAYPFAAHSQITPCAAILETKSIDQLGVLLEAAGKERIKIKSERMDMAIRAKGSSQACYEEIMAALGYKQNRGPFRKLAELLPLEELKEESSMNINAAYSLLMGVSGLLPTRMEARWNDEARLFIRRLWDYWWKHQSRWQSRSLNKSAWKMKNIRPQNHPRRRLMTAAILFCGSFDIAKQIIQTPSSQPTQWTKKMISLLQTTPSSPCYWEFHLGFSGTRRPKRIALLGQRRAAAILSNVIVPFAAVKKPDLLNIGLLRQLAPEEDNSIVRQTAHTLFGSNHNPCLYRTGLRQQGLIQIFHDYCLSDRSGCKGCSLPKILERL